MTERCDGLSDRFSDRIPFECAPGGTCGLFQASETLCEAVFHVEQSHHDAQEAQHVRLQSEPQSCETRHHHLPRGRRSLRSLDMSVELSPAPAQPCDPEGEGVLSSSPQARGRSQNVEDRPRPRSSPPPRKAPVRAVSLILIQPLPRLLHVSSSQDVRALYNHPRASGDHWPGRRALIGVSGF